MKEKAIFELYPNITRITKNNNEVIYYDIDGNVVDTNVDMSAVETKATELETAKETAKAKKEADALAGNNKLLELGLTQAQATALTGYTPPAEV